MQWAFWKKKVSELGGEQFGYWSPQMVILNNVRDGKFVGLTLDKTINELTNTING